MFVDYQIFFGFPLSHSFEEHLRQVAPEIRSFFIQDHPDYLQQVEHEGILYLGKRLGPLVEGHSLELISSHIHSLLKRLVPHYPYEEHSLLLFAIKIH